MKRVFDFVCAFILLMIFIVPMIILAVMIKVKLGSPILFKQLRPGQYEKPFLLFKFRTMTNEKDANGFLLSDEIRLTSFGKFLRRFSLDELPQLFNVIKGDVSLVGPRPLLMEYLPLYTKEQAKRHLVKPGITGWAQVNGRNHLTWEEKFKLDVWYAENRTFRLDIKILMITLLKVIKSEGIQQTGFATAEKFKGTGMD
ncbi:sugar transferase [Metabacillus sp. GX 13764]|uniref:sugar transferase n=1 Tax=Metabacillus kandeliae TaxID=2900151 RepID=UPI001E52580D|nr:sugar transferase [Metabacillus kandeliae]MCD7033146.1 sugar transferase [Metabacillus kandeliae]